MCIFGDALSITVVNNVGPLTISLYTKSQHENVGLFLEKITRECN